jgi:glutathione S-transferase
MTATTSALFGRSSSTFTRVARIFAEELAVPYSFEIVRNLEALDTAAYGDNPALKVPSLRTPRATWFGALNICRELARASALPRCIVWPEALEQPLLANMQELVLHAMSTEVALIMSSLSGQPTDTPHRLKMMRSLTNVLTWLDANLEAALSALPGERELSYLEVTLFCLVAHLDFRKVVATAPYAKLSAFRDDFGARSACTATEYGFDP